MTKQPSPDPSVALRWDEKYRQGEHVSTAPAAILEASVAHWDGCPNRQALDLACGAGRNAVYLAAKGWRVRAVDFSLEALARTQALAVENGVSVETSREDIEAPGWSAGEALYGLVVVTQFLHRPLFPAIRAAVAPGGLLIYETYTIDQLQLSGGPRNAKYLLDPNELPERFRDWHVLRYEEACEARATAALIARKPSPQQ